MNERILAAAGIVLPRSARILDFGCGSGRHVYEYFDAGYEGVEGYDARDYVSLRAPADRTRFRFRGEQNLIPFDDNSFDFIYSTSVFEHVQNQANSWKEIYRILKPSAVSLHAFPARWRPIEPHTFVPFGGVVTHKMWCLLWAGLGIRNSFQTGLSPGEIAQAKRFTFGTE